MGGRAGTGRESRTARTPNTTRDTASFSGTPGKGRRAPVVPEGRTGHADRRMLLEHRGHPRDASGCAQIPRRRKRHQDTGRTVRWREARASSPAGYRDGDGGAVTYHVLRPRPRVPPSPRLRLRGRTQDDGRGLQELPYRPRTATPWRHGRGALPPANSVSARVEDKLGRKYPDPSI